MNSSSNKLEIDVPALIELVKERPCIWCKKHDLHADKVERKAAWKEIFASLHEDYDSLTGEERRTFEEVIQSKWTNIRDTFIKTLKPKGRKTKKYVYYEQLSFLMNNIKGTVPATTTGWDAEDQDEKYFEFHTNDEDVPQISNVRTKKEKKKRRRDSPVESDILYVTDPADFIQEANYGADSKLFPDNDDPRVMNEDEAFFASLLPTIATYATEERLEFRMEVLSVMKRIHDKRSSTL